MPRVNFLGKVHNFPDNVTDEQIRGALTTWSETNANSDTLSKPDTSSAMRTERTNVSARAEYVPEGEQFPELPSMDSSQQQFVDTIGEIETGGLSNRYIRTKVKPSSGGTGSSAYGTYQITHGLLEGTLTNQPDLLSPVEQGAARELMERQEIGLAIGGNDRVKYEQGGKKHALAQKWAKDYGFETVDAFLDAFDYGGDLGLSKDEDFQTLYEGFARKMMLKQLKDVGGDALEAASAWHGGSNWRKGGHKGTTEKYRSKYQRLTE